MKTFSVLILASLVSSMAVASFDENSLRYLSGPEISNAILNVLPPPPYNQESCTKIDKGNRSALGISDPGVGQPISPAPNAATIQWIGTCVNAVFKNPMHNWTFSQVKKLTGQEFIEAVKDPRFNEPPSTNDALPPTLYMRLMDPYNVLKPAAKKALIEGLVKNILGSDEVILDFGLIKDANAFRDRLLQEAEKIKSNSTTEVIRYLTLNLMLRDEFLSY